MALSTYVLHLPQVTNARLAAANTSRIVCSSFAGFKGSMAHVQKGSFSSSSSLSFVSRNLKIRLQSATNTPIKDLSSELQETENIHLENTPIKLWEVCPEPVRNFPWKKAGERVIHNLFQPILGVAKRLLIPILAVTFFMEASYCVAQNKELFIPFGLLAGCVFAEILKETAIELSQNLKEGGFPWHLLAIALIFSFMKVLGPFYPYWGRILLPHFANGGLWQTIWLTRNWHKNQSQTTEVESNGENIRPESDLKTEYS